MRLLRILLVTLALLTTLPADLLAAPKTLVYTGSLTDEEGGPVAGIYWFRFSLHRSRSEKKMLWSEEMYVAIDRGTYQVELGKERPIPQALALTGLFLSVHIDGIEVHRQQVEESMVSGGRSPVADVATGSGAECENCRKAVVAERAEDCERVGGMSAKQLVDQVAKKQIRVGTSAHFTSSVGAGEGTPFRLTCPPGFVVTGIKGKAEDTISNMQLVCSPVETK
jgi:hypothetical protein